MKTSAAFVKLLAFMIVTSMMTFVLAATIGNFSFGGRTSYTAVFDDVTGVIPGNEVRIAGVRVGTVDGLSRATDPQTGLPIAKVRFSLDDDRVLNDSALVKIRYRNLVGERYLAIIPSPGLGRTLPADSEIPRERTQEALDLTVLFNGFTPLFQALDAKAINDLSFEIVRTLQGEGGTIEALLARTASLTRTLADRDAVIGRVIDNLSVVLATIDERDAQLNSLITQVQRLSRGFAQDRQALFGSLEGINDLTSATTGLLAEIRAPLRQDIAELATLAATLDDNKQVVDDTLARLPERLNRLVSTATDGSWFNFYLCGANLTGLEALVPGIETPPLALVNPAPRCNTEVAS